MGKQNVLRFIPNTIRFTRLEELYVNKALSLDEISKKLGIGRTSLRNWLNKSGFEHRHALGSELVKKYPEEDIVRDYFKLKSIETIVKERGVYKTNVSSILRNWGIKSQKNLNNIRRHVNGNFNLQINDTLQNYIIGGLLGDLSIESNKRIVSSLDINEYYSSLTFIRSYKTDNDKLLDIQGFNQNAEIIGKAPLARLILTSSILQAPYVYYLSECFANNNFPLSITPNIGTNKKYPNLSLYSTKYIDVGLLYSKWYPQGIKIVPRYFKLTPSIILHWFIGDGSYQDRISFATHSFSTNDVNFLIKRLKIDLNINSSLYISKDGPEIKIYTKRDKEYFFLILDQEKNDSDFCKQFFPWKFNERMTKKEVLSTNEYKEKVKKYLIDRNSSFTNKVLEYIDNY